jgi:hypothetical protein
LVKGLILEYIKTTKSSDGEIMFHLITHEQKEFSLSQQAIERKESELSDLNIKWYRVHYLSGSLLILKKAINFIQTFFIALKIKWQHKPVAIVGFLAIAGGFSYLLSKLLRLKLVVYCFEPHSEYMIDFKIWKTSSLKYKLLKKFEKLQIINADHIIVPNNYSRSLVESYKPSAKIYVCPISISTDHMTFDSAARNRIRKNLNIENRMVIIYTGKFGGIYHSSDEVVEFFSRLYSQNNLFFFYIITPNLDELQNSIAKYKLSQQSVHASLTVSYDELNQHISAADIGFVALPSLPSQIYRTPVKTAIYLSCGLPYIVNKNIGEDDSIALNKNIGVVIKDLNEDPVLINNKITELLKKDPAQLRLRCRSEAENTRSIAAARVVLSEIFSEL